MAVIGIAIIQSAPVASDLEASLEVLETQVHDASTDASLVVVGETWLPGYPAWLDVCPGAALWDHQPVKQAFARLRRNSVVVGGDAFNRLSRLAAATGVVLVVGVHERVDAGPGAGTLYNSILTFGADGTLVNHHRKLVPTYTERLVWGPGDGAGLQAVQTPFGRVGSLICWEHFMPLARQAMHESREHIHVAQWPMVKEINLVACRQYALEGRCYVLASGQIMRARDLPPGLDRPDGLTDDAFVLRGGSAVIAPDGSFVVEPVYDEETIVRAMLDLSRIDEETMTLDATGHYARPDVLRLMVNRARG